MPISVLEIVWLHPGYARTYASRVVRGLLLVALFLASSPTQAIALPQMAFSMPDSASFNWEVASQEMQLFGLPIVWRSFSASVPLQKAAELLSASTDRFQRVIAFKDRIMLSGVNGDWNWVAELEATPHGVKGRVSALHIGTDRVQQALSQRSDLTFNWLPVQAQLRFTQVSAVNGDHARQQLYSVNMSREDLKSYLQVQLSQAGWRDESSGTWLPGASVWTRKAMRLVLVAQQLTGNSSSLFVHYSE